MVSGGQATQNDRLSYGVAMATIAGWSFVEKIGFLTMVTVAMRRFSGDLTKFQGARRTSGYAESPSELISTTRVKNPPR